MHNSHAFYNVKIYNENLQPTAISLKYFTKYVAFAKNYRECAFSIPMNLMFNKEVIK